MRDSQSVQEVKRPAACPSCESKTVDTLAKVYTETTVWRCRQCDETWTIKSARQALRY